MLGGGLRPRFWGATPPPGSQTWGGGRLLPGLRRTLGDFQPVLALTVIRHRGESPEILVGVRDPESNRTHQNVASVPTRRVRLDVARRWLWQLRTGRGAAATRRHDLRDEVAHTFSLKLGLADARERGLVDFDVVSLSAFQGISVIGERSDGQPLTENLTMFNAIITLTRGDDEVPRETASYKPLVWAGTGDFTAMTRSRDIGRLNVGLENSFFCAYGLCLQTSARMLTDHGLSVSARRRQGDPAGSVSVPPART
jgi:hypothetical protein